MEDSPPPYNSSVDTDNDSATSLDGTPGSDLCPECDPPHVRRRLVVCADGTWMTPDGAIGSFNGNASNMARIWSMIKTDEVKDDSGRRWQQKRLFVEGIGAVSDFLERTYMGVTGQGYAEKIKTIYKACCTDMCPKDEIFLFGYSRGAFVVRAVAGLLHHMGMLDVQSSDFDQRFDKALDLYRHAQDKSKLHEQSVYQHLSEVQSSPVIKFLGVIDTVKALDDDNLHDIGAVESIQHIRHAVALFEKRTIMSPEHFDVPADIAQGLSIQTAWFVGTHGSLGGSNSQDGLSLFPLQWLVSEATRQGLVLGFKRIAPSNVVDPAELILQRRGDTVVNFSCKNGIAVTMADLKAVLRRDGFQPRMMTGKGRFPSPEEFRPLFEPMTSLLGARKLIGQRMDSLSSHFIHPSVYYLDDTSAHTVHAINTHPEGRLIRKDKSFSIFAGDHIFWVNSEELQLFRWPTSPRILLCGQSNAGKSSLINLLLGRNASNVSHTLDPGQHDINVALTNTGGSIVLHDSQGFEAGGSRHFDEVEHFVKHCRRQTVFDNQLHCIWYCVSTDHNRAEDVERRFSQIDLGGVPVLLVFTKTDNLRRSCDQQALDEYNTANNRRITIYEFAEISREHRNDISRRAVELLSRKKQRRVETWQRKFPGLFSNVIFISTRGTLEDELESTTRLIELSRQAMTGETMAAIHAHAQDNEIEARWDKALDAIIEICNQKGDMMACLGKWKMNVLLQDIIREVLQRLSSIFGLEGLEGDTAFAILWQNLYADEGQASTLVMLLSGGGGMVAGVIGSAFLGPIGWLAISAPTFVGFTVARHLRFANAIICACLETALVLDRLFWFGKPRLNEEFITAAVLYQLKQSPKLYEITMDKLDLTDRISKMKPKLQVIVKKFRYTRRTNPSAA